jgi:glycerol uptake facilitator-like aquaporin
MPAMTVAYASLRRDQISDATPQMNVLQRVGGAIGTAVLAVVLQRAGAAAVATGHALTHATSATQAAALHVTLQQQLAHAFDTSYWWAFGIAALSLIPCLFLLRAERPQQTERAEEPLEAAMEAVGV